MKKTPQQLPLAIDDESNWIPRVTKRVVRHEQIDRQWRILLRLANCRRGVTWTNLRESAVELGGAPVTERTIRRDIEALIAAGFDIEARRDDDGRARLKLNEVASVDRLARHHSTAA